MDLSITKLRQGSFFPSLLERRRRIDQALFALVMEAYVTGASVRKVDDLVKALGADTGISKSEVSRICADLDEQVAGFADRDLSEFAFPYVFLDATYCKARAGGATNGKGSRVVSQAVAAVVLGRAWQRCRCTSCATSSPRFPRAPRRWSPPRSAPASLRRLINVDLDMKAGSP